MKPKQSFRFFANDLKPFHPLSTSFTTDAEYAQVANRLYAAFLEHKLNAITTDVTMPAASPSISRMSWPMLASGVRSSRA